MKGFFNEPMKQKRHSIYMRKRLLAWALLFAMLASFASCASCFTIDMGETVMSYQGEKITTVELTYWMATLKTQYLSSSVAPANDSPAYWNSEAGDGLTHKENFDAILQNWLKELLVAKYLFREWGLEYTNGGKTAAKNELADLKKYYKGDEAEWEEQLYRLGVTEESLVQIYLEEQKLKEVRSRIIADLTASNLLYAQTLQEYYLENYANVTFVTIYLNVDPNHGYEKLTEAQIAQKEAKVQEVISKTEAGEQPGKLVSEYSEFDMSAVPNGVYVSMSDRYTYGTEFCEKALELEEGAWARLDAEQDGVKCAYILYKIPYRDYEGMSENELALLVERTQLSHCGTIMNEYSKNVTVHTEVWEQFSVITALGSLNTNF